MSPNHHPQPDTLISYAAGTLPSSIACVVACHVSLCPDCKEHVRRLGILGGLMLDTLQPAPADEVFTELAAKALSPESLPPRTERRVSAPRADDPILPRPLVRRLRLSASTIPWKRVVKGVRQHWVKLPKGSGQMRLLRLAPGKVLLEHRHTGMELTIVLQGSYGDHSGEYQRGDVIEWAEGTLHQPRAFGDEECICLIAFESTPYFTRLAARLLRPIMGF
jgi:putative transcriptional regulator